MEKTILEFRPKRSLGQIFLKSERIAQRMIDALDIKENESVLEIGAGKGIITKRLAPIAKRVYAVEIDERLIENLKDETKEFGNVEIINEDILKLDLSSFNRIKIIGNIPYSLTTPLLFRLFKFRELWERMVLTLQKEFADRILSPPNTKRYGSITVAVRLYTETQRLFSIPPSFFYPPPKVSSSSLLFKKREKLLVELKDEELLFRVVRASFTHRRKFISNGLKSAFGLTSFQLSDIQKRTGIDLKRRAETLTVEEFGELANNISSII